MSLKLEQTPQKIQILSPKLRQSNSILQLAAPAFQLFIQEQLQNNPFLEEEQELEEIHIQEYHSSQFPVGVSKTAEQQSEDDFLANCFQTISLEDHLTQELDCLSLPEKQYHLALFIINALDENGYLRCSFQELLPPKEHSSISLSEWEQCLRLVQRIAPPGIGARDLKECLTLQVEAASDLPKRKKEQLYLLINSGLQWIAENNEKKLRQLFTNPLPELANLISYIKQLDPKPGRNFSSTLTPTSIPDVLVTKKQNQWHIIPNFKAYPRIKVQCSHEHLLQHSQLPASHPLQQAWQDANWISTSIEKRHHTICEVAKIILKKQQLFFQYGEEALQPLLINDIAHELRLHESTISRATSNKYMSTPKGVFAFRYFFSRDVAMSFGGVCSTQMVKARIKHHIETESSAAPLSDVALHQLLLHEEIKIAKRTVTKYRQQLHIPNSKERRQTETPFFL